MPLPRVQFALILALSTVGLAGCGPDISPEVEEYAGLVNEGRMLTCVCFSDVGYDTMISCEAAQGDISKDDQECMLDAFDGEEDLGASYFDCANPILAAYSQCILADPGCEAGWADDCRATRDGSLAECPALPQGILTRFNACHL